MLCYCNYITYDSITLCQCNYIMLHYYNIIMLPYLFISLGKHAWFLYVEINLLMWTI